jgi:peptide deformylase
MLSNALDKRIVKYPGRALRQPAKPITTFDNKLKNLAQRMSFLMIQCEGIGLAANQLGRSESMFVYIHEGKSYACINPRYTKGTVPVREEKEAKEEEHVSEEISESSEEDVVTGIEGCLSITNRWLYVPRYECIKVSYQNASGMPVERILEGYEARIYQHEWDHLQGKLIIDYDEATKDDQIGNQGS